MLHYTAVASQATVIILYTVQDILQLTAWNVYPMRVASVSGCT